MVVIKGRRPDGTVDSDGYDTGEDSDEEEGQEVPLDGTKVCSINDLYAVTSLLVHKGWLTRSAFVGEARREARYSTAACQVDLVPRHEVRQLGRKRHVADSSHAFLQRIKGESFVSAEQGQKVGGIQPVAHDADVSWRLESGFK